MLRGRKIALPGRLTTAALLLRLFDHGLKNLVYLPFDQIMPACRRGEVDAGVIIHESRFTFAEHGLSQVIDLGAWWEGETGIRFPWAVSSRGGTWAAPCTNGSTGRYDRASNTHTPILVK